MDPEAAEEMKDSLTYSLQTVEIDDAVSPPVTPKDMRLSTVSSKYDRGQKGYLDTTEFKLRQMDTENLGYLDVSKVYKIMEQLQGEQKKAMNLKKVVVALSVFSLLLALANIGTSYATAVLARDTQYDPSTGKYTLKGSNQVIGTTNVKDVIDLGETPVQQNGTRLLDGVDTSQTGSLFTVTRANADVIYKALCSNWKGMDEWDGSTFTCSQQSSSIALNHCGFQTDFKLKSNPSPTSTGGAIIFKYKACRDGWCYNNNAQVWCTNGSADCLVSGLKCKTDCSMCVNGGGADAHWWCNSNQECGCTPSECLDFQPFCFEGCYTPST